MTNFAIDFFVFSYFGKSIEELHNNPDNAIKVCAEKAYLDFNRTLSYTSDSEEKHQNGKNPREIFVDDICNMLSESIPRLFVSPDSFDCIHNELCVQIIRCASMQENLWKQNKTLCYGHAQKWLNMTLKYMYILGFWPEMSNLEHVLHVPVDSYILEAVWRAKHSGKKTNKGYKEKCELLKNTLLLPEKLFIPIIEGEKEENCAYSSAPIKAWSTWGLDTDVGVCQDYLNFQQGIREALNGKCTPLEWEGSTWILVAQERNHK